VTPVGHRKKMDKSMKGYGLYASHFSEGGIMLLD